MDKEQKIFYASLFLAGKPLELKFFRNMFEPVNLENRLAEYAEAFNNLGVGMRIRSVSGGFQMVSEAEVLSELEPYFGEKTETLGRASLETAGIIAYQQPITRQEIDDIRGVNSTGALRYLLDRNLIKVSGRKETPGKPLEYSTTSYFLEYFGLNSLSELPTKREWEELREK